MDSDNPVSYTHLDVYKRQGGAVQLDPVVVHNGADGVQGEVGRRHGGLPHLALLEPVSYTHLDVYKRQEPASCPSLTRGKFAYDFCDTGMVCPLAKMYTCLLYTSRL